MTASGTTINRQRLLEAAMRVFAESGFRGATTRKIAETAGVNEVTLFRQFKSKSALINEAAEMYARQRSEHDLPIHPVSPQEELAEWCATHLRLMRERRDVIRKCMAEVVEHPQMAECMRKGPDVVHEQLRRYATALGRKHRLKLSADEMNVACMMLQGSLFADVMGRDVMPELFPRPLREAGAQYARAFLRLLGIEPGAMAPGRRETSGTGNGGHAAARARNGKDHNRSRTARRT